MGKSKSKMKGFKGGILAEKKEGDKKKHKNEEDMSQIATKFYQQQFLGGYVAESCAVHSKVDQIHDVDNDFQSPQYFCLDFGLTARSPHQTD